MSLRILIDDTVRDIAREIADRAAIDWPIRESSRAKRMVLVRIPLAKRGYPPDKAEKAIETILKQAELLADSLVQLE